MGKFSVLILLLGLSFYSVNSDSDTNSNKKLRGMLYLFSKFDLNGDKTITINELGSLMESIGQELTPDELQEMFDEADVDHDGHIRIIEFVNLMKSIEKTKNDTNDMRVAFNTFDSNRDGFITAQELSKAMTLMKNYMTEEEAQTVITELDTDGDNKLNYDEFVKMMSKDITEIDDYYMAWTVDELKALFVETDKDRDGKITAEQLKELIQDEFGYRDITDEEVEIMIAAVDTDKDKLLNCKEFIELMSIVVNFKSINTK